MPDCCDRCFAFSDNGDYPFCLITQEQRGYNFNARGRRMDKCPLVEVPPHGRLIDADLLDHQIYNDIPLKVFGNIARMAEMRNIVGNALTVIPEERNM